MLSHQITDYDYAQRRDIELMDDSVYIIKGSCLLIVLHDHAYMRSQQSND